MPPVALPPDVDDRCTCGHIKGEHLGATAEASTGQCLIFGCHCRKFKQASNDEQAGPPRSATKV